MKEIIASNIEYYKYYIDKNTTFVFLKIGKDVTNQISQGAVVFDQSDATIRANKVEIKSATINRNAKVTFKKRN